MVIYSEVIDKFLDDVNNNNISKILNNKFKEKTFKYSTKSEIESWDASLEYMSNILSKSNLSKNCTVTLEYKLPMTSKRVDFILSGYNEYYKEVLLLFELKQWSEVENVECSDVLLKTFIGGSIKEVLHPAYQVLSYQELLEDYNEYIQSNNVILKSSVIMHNYTQRNNDPIVEGKFKHILDETSIFMKDDEEKLIKYLNTNLKFGDDKKIIDLIEKSNISPSKKLQNNIRELINGNNTFTLIDEQKMVYDKILSLINDDNKKVIIVEGGPGSGKSVLAINLLATVTSKGKLCQYVSRNTAPRVVYSYQLKGTMNKNSIDNLFKSSGSYTDINENIFDLLIVDEAHCLTEKSGLFNNYGENQIKEIINSGKTSVFFIDEKQRVHVNDIGTVDEIKKWANYFGCEVLNFSLNSQFRCNGSDTYLNFIDYILDIKNDYLSQKVDYNIMVVDDPFELDAIIRKKNINYNARILAGYCWDWNKKEVNNSEYHDIKIGDYEISWNLGQNQTYAIDDSINEVGCIHSVQGLEFDYVGVIIGDDIRFENGKIITDFTKHASTDPSLKGIKTLYKKDKEKALKLADIIIKNTYRVLLTRGIKGCIVYCVDKQLNEYMRQMINKYKY